MLGSENSAVPRNGTNNLQHSNLKDYKKIVLADIRIIKSGFYYIV